MALNCALYVLAVAALQGRALAGDASCAANTNCAVAGLEGECCPTSGGEFLVCCDVVPNTLPEHGCENTRWGCCEGTQIAAHGSAQEGCSQNIDANTDGDSEKGSGGVPDKGGCAVDITAGIASITSAAKFITYAVDDCDGITGEAGKRACADDITSAITDFAGAAKAIESATFTCGGIETTCAKDITNSIQSLSASSEALICAASDCEEGADGYDAFACIVDIFDTTDTLVHLSKSIYDAVDNCAPVENDSPSITTQGGASTLPAEAPPSENDGPFITTAGGASTMPAAASRP